MGDGTSVSATTADAATIANGQLDKNIAAATVADGLNRATAFAGFTALASTDGSAKVTINKGAISVSSTSEAQSAIGKKVIPRYKRTARFAWRLFKPF